MRRYVTDAGDLLPRLHKLVRSDSTTRNKRRAAALSETYDSLEQRIAELSELEDLARVRPDLDGNAIMELLGHRPGPRGRRGLADAQGAAARARPALPRGRRGGAARLVGRPELTRRSRDAPLRAAWRA